MWQIAVLSCGQHDQFCTTRAKFALVKRSTRGPWRLDDADEADADTGPVLSLQIDADILRLECRGVSGHVERDDGAAFWTGKLIELELPSLFRIDDAWFEIRSTTARPATDFEPLNRAAARSGVGGAWAGPEAQTIAHWLASVGRLHRAAASAPEFYSIAAQLTLESTGLDAAMILMRTDDRWRIAGSAVPQPQYGIAYDAAALALAFDRPEVWRSPVAKAGAQAERTNLSQQSVVVAPVVDDQGEVVAAVYGMRHGQGDNRRRGIRPLEARVVELMADAVGVGLARRIQEVESSRRQVLLEQAFSPAVVEHLRRHPESLAGQTRACTLLFADLRGFTAVAEQLSPSESYELLGAVMEQLTQAVMDHGGVVIDYYGDGLSALWNAPLDVPEHADLACTAAMHMLDSLPAINDAWRGKLRRPLEMGVGVHTGEVLVGNAGTRRRLKYGPRGAAVNLASRVQAATRPLDVPLLATDAVRRRLSTRFVTLKVCTARLPGVEQPLDLFTVFPATDGQRLQEDMECYAAALAAFEEGDLDAAESVLADLLERGPATPAAFLAQQAAALRQSSLGRRASDQFGRTRDAVIEILAK